jgi:membrane fusion protein (multidrug efflux system)
MNKKLRLVITSLLIILLIGIVFYPKYKPILTKKIKGEGIAGAPLRQVQQKLNAVGFVVVPRHLSDIIKQSGTLKPDEEVELSFETSGKIVGINFTEGSRVKKGELLAKINDRPLQAQLEKLVAQLKMAEAKEFRQRSLLEKDAISQESYDQVQTDVQSLNADINLIRARISETELRAPFDGIIGLRDLSEGSFVTSTTKIVRLTKISPLKMEFAISQKYASEIKIGYPITFNIEGFSKPFNASVYAIEPKIDMETRTIVLRAMYQNKNEELKPGVSANITLELSNVDNAIAIPTEALIPETEGVKVFIYKKGKAQSVKVNLGLRTEALVQITEGLNFGDTLITSGIMQLRQNLPIILDTVIVNN